MMNSDAERHIGETMAVVLRERLIDLESLEATGEATEEARQIGRLFRRGARVRHAAFWRREHPFAASRDLMQRSSGTLQASAP